ncbi:hypothetical protein NKG05_00410 [Oerskovia sp. M15]
MPSSHLDLADPGLLTFEYMQQMAAVLGSLPAGPLRVVHLGAAGAPWRGTSSTNAPTRDRLPWISTPTSSPRSASGSRCRGRRASGSARVTPGPSWPPCRTRASTRSSATSSPGTRP